jgi:hypothetical protein
MIRVFIASPGDLAPERALFRDTVAELNATSGASTEFEALGREDTLAVTGARPQGVINEKVDVCDIFVLALYRRWGQDAPEALG